MPSTVALRARRAAFAALTAAAAAFPFAADARAGAKAHAAVQPIARPAVQTAVVTPSSGSPKARVGLSKRRPTASIAARRRARRAAACTGADLAPAAANRGRTRSATLCLLNVERTSRGLRALRADDRLEIAAQRHSDDMVARDYFDHVTPSGADVVARLSRAGYVSDEVSWAVGENIAWGSGDLATPREIVRAWMNSTGHRRNILDRRYREIGIGVARGVPGRDIEGATYTTDFGTRS